MNTCSAFRPGRHHPALYLATLIAFVVYWPVGLALGAYILWGDHFRQFAGDMRSRFDGAFGGSRQGGGFSADFGRTGNVAFDDYRTRELKRLEEERRKLDEMRAEFDAFLRELRRAKDQEEFDRFMANRGNFRPDAPPSGT